MFPCTSEVCNNLSCFLKIVVKLVELQSFMYTLSPWFGLWGAYFNLRCKYLDNKKTCPKSGGSLLGENTLCYTGFNQSQQEEAKQHFCHESGYHSLKLHITHGLHLPACTALTHSRPPLHQSHSCHHSLINPDCLTTPAPHSLTHIKAAHKHSLTAKSCFALATFLSVLPRICYLCV